ncbi:MAG: PorV/PorQ family protein [Sinomicrobium sp.]|nr:PorV/PorQ family protein [Sinomicrobium sp.]
MNIGVDAAAFGMSNAVVASVDNASAGYWNPAGLTHLEDNQLGLMHASYFANIAQYDYAGFAMPIDSVSAFAVSMLRFGVDDILNTTQLIDEEGNIDYNNISLFSAADYGFVFSYARKPHVEGLSYGVNAKVIRRIIGDFASSWGFGFDLGLQYRKNNWHFGLMLRDITTTFNTWRIDEDLFNAVSDEIPEQELPETTEITLPKMQLGASRTFLFNNRYSLMAEIDLNMRFAATEDLISSSFVSISPAAGVEFAYTRMAFLRVGIGNFQHATDLSGSESLSFQPNIGIGFKYKGIQIDYALTDIGDQSAAIYSNVFSLKMDWELFR